MKKKIFSLFIGLGVLSGASYAVFGAQPEFEINVSEMTNQQIEETIIAAAVDGDIPTFIVREGSVEDMARYQAAYKRIRESMNIPLDTEDLNIYNHIRKKKQSEGVNIKADKKADYGKKKLK